MNARLRLADRGPGTVAWLACRQPRQPHQPVGRVAGILLAAGEGRRLGQPKALVEIGGEPLARRGVALLRDGGAAPIVVVTGAVAVDLPGVLAVHNPDWRSGMGSSLAAGLATVPDSARRP